MATSCNAPAAPDPTGSGPLQPRDPAVPPPDPAAVPPSNESIPAFHPVSSPTYTNGGAVISPTLTRDHRAEPRAPAAPPSTLDRSVSASWVPDAHLTGSPTISPTVRSYRGAAHDLLASAAHTASGMLSAALARVGLSPVPPRRPSTAPGLGSDVAITSPVESSVKARHVRRLSASRDLFTPVREGVVTEHQEDDEGTSTRINQYRLVRRLGKGAFGTVHMAVDERTKIEYAIKEFSKARLRKAQWAINARHRRMNRGGGRSISGRSPMPARGSPYMTRSTSRPVVEPRSGRTSPAVTTTETSCPGDDDILHREIAILRKLHHPNCVKLLEVLEVPDGDQIYMVFEMCHGGPILRVENEPFDPFPEDKARDYCQQILLGLEYLHEHHIVHRDLKPDNLLLAADGTVKIVDFSVSECFASTDDILSSAGSPAFLAPELCRVQSTPAVAVPESRPASGRAADIYSFGVTLYCMVFGRLPFHGESVLDLYRAIATSEPDYTPSRGASAVSLAPVRAIGDAGARSMDGIGTGPVQPASLPSCTSRSADAVGPPPVRDVGLVTSSPTTTSPRTISSSPTTTSPRAISGSPTTFSPRATSTTASLTTPGSPASAPTLTTPPSPDLLDLLHRMLAKDPAHRITLDQMRVHPWITDHDRQELPSKADNVAVVIRPEDLTHDEIEAAIAPINPLWTVVKFIANLKRRASMSASSASLARPASTMSLSGGGAGSRNGDTRSAGDGSAGAVTTDGTGTSPANPASPASPRQAPHVWRRRASSPGALMVPRPMLAFRAALNLDTSEMPVSPRGSRSSPQGLGLSAVPDEEDVKDSAVVAGDQGAGIVLPMGEPAVGDGISSNGSMANGHGSSALGLVERTGAPRYSPVPDKNCPPDGVPSPGTDGRGRGTESPMEVVGPDGLAGSGQRPDVRQGGAVL
ncbi:CAMKK/CAMKK-META protein kinase [Allomyces macrogynus ATCC 38327]|uniref:CAMKK/CAMKK-META protein kinase n=1 Tax=Allomyces macrogynus (strain ATCC 38327) TaxID=578462 RepID=A0A0L0T2N2_ALLM3|nr:CAMKK/CAMKK-META protein kinase [Allomyces macrogynus ATCC 38327]|eukprot:KNE68859.1 CAMKK/CAMKK-META protein kinase [Allomyces macrogynus ATCC 38327]